MFGAGVCVNAQLNLPWSLCAAVGIRPGVLVSTGLDGKTDVYFRVPAGMSLGFRF